jgi:N-sulfoglucosamine sulfohydrolase
VKPPNILFLFADDWGRYASAYRTVDGEKSLNAVVKTPNFDRVAREGVLFTNAFVPAPSCTPCRSALLSGQYWWRTGRGAILRGAVWDRAIPTYPLLLQDAGWHIGFTGKVWSPGTPADAPYGAPANRYAKAGSAISSYGELMMAAADRPAKQREIFAQVAANFSQFLADRKPNQPWCYWFGPTQTHRMWAAGSGKTLWGIEPDSLKGRLPAFLPDNELVRADIADYLGEVQSVDAALGVLLQELEKAGELNRTFIVVSGDHGMPGMPRGKCTLYGFGTRVALAVRWPRFIPLGRTVDDFVNLMDLAPTFLEAAGLKPLQAMSGRSLLPLLMSHKSGLVDPTRSFVITGRERHVDTAREGNLPYPHRAIRTKDWLYIRNFAPDRWPMGAPANERSAPEAVAKNTFATFADMDAGPTKAWLVAHGAEPANKKFYDLAFAKRPAEELYDLRNDPDEINNIAADPACADIRAKLNAQLMEELKRTGDPRVTGDGSTYDKPPFAGAAEAVRQPK